MTWIRVAAAMPPGGVFSGPTRASGFSLYWNPAAVAASPEGYQTHVEATLSVAHLTYARAGLDPNTGAAFESVGFWTPGPDLAITLASPVLFDHLRFVGGVFCPTALATDWPEEGPQRYFGTRSMFITGAAVLGPVLQLGDTFGAAMVAGPMYGFLRLNTALDLGAFVNGKLPAGSPLLPLEDPLLESHEHVKADAWSLMTGFGAWVRPVPWARFGLGLLLPRGFYLRGTATVDTSESLQRALPGFNLAPEGKVEVRYPMPWQASAEGEVQLGLYKAAVLFQYTRKSRQRAIFATVTEATPKFIEGRQLSVKGAHDDWLVGVRLGREVRDDLELAARVDYDPRYIPDETVHPVNLDYTQIDAGLGAFWRLSPRLAMTFSYSFIYLQPFTVTTSIYRPSAPPESGLGLPSANGDYGGMAHTLSVGLEGMFGAPPPPPPPELLNDLLPVSEDSQ
ncbi:MAG: hypothetical protein HY903_12050 [Deltaproteobacteria bacterium]|nr:hypothetical protein [Deltaproteobacteria bacterium]